MKCWGASSLSGSGIHMLKGMAEASLQGFLWPIMLFLTISSGHRHMASLCCLQDTQWGLVFWWVEQTFLCVWSRVHTAEERNVNQWTHNNKINESLCPWSHDLWILLQYEWVCVEWSLSSFTLSGNCILGCYEYLRNCYNYYIINALLNHLFFKEFFLYT